MYLEMTCMTRGWKQMKGDRRRGTVASVVALLTPVIVGVSALTLDGGLMYLQRRQAQSIADASALAGAYTYYNTSNYALAQSAAIAMAGQNGVTITAAQVTSPQTGYVSVSVTTTQARTFSALWGAGTMSTTASTTARGTSSTQPYSTAGVLVLDPSSSGSMAVCGGAHVTCGAPIQVNSSSSTAVQVSNGAQLDSSVDVVGGYTVANGSHVDGTITTGVASVGDPLSSLPTPSVPAATTTPMSNYQGWGSFQMQPGYYSGGVSLGNGGTFTMAPGLYYISGGDFNVGNGATLTGNGVTIFMDNSSGGTINFEGGTKTTLTPSSSGTYSGLSYFQDRNNATAPNFANGSTINLSGSFYAAAAPITFAGGSKTNEYGSQMVCKSVNFSNGCDVDIPYTTGSVASKTQSSVAIVK